MEIEKMVHEANQIAAFFESFPREEAVAGIEDHLKKFWEPRMRKQIVEHVGCGGAGLDKPVVEAVSRLGF